ncbi:MAG: hypothetical protein ACQEP9_02070, partial [Bacillota bacterium]
DVLDEAELLSFEIGVEEDDDILSVPEEISLIEESDEEDLDLDIGIGESYLNIEEVGEEELLNCPECKTDLNGDEKMCPQCGFDLY